MSNNKKLVGLRLSDKIIDWYDKKSKETGLNRSELMRIALVNYMNILPNNDWKKLEFLMSQINKIK